jgi:hypothetical protein
VLVPLVQPLVPVLVLVLVLVLLLLLLLRDGCCCDGPRSSRHCNG